jgi:hypothetical protein
MPARVDRYSLATVRVIRKSLQEIKRETGVITSRSVLDYARDQKSPLHSFFDWDDRTAAEKFRIHQASEMIRHVCVYVERDGTQQPTRVYLNVIKNDVRQYVPVTQIYRDEELAQQMMLEMRRDMEGLLRRYKTYDYCAKSIGLIEAAISALDLEDDG